MGGMQDPELCIGPFSLTWSSPILCQGLLQNGVAPLQGNLPYSGEEDKRGCQLQRVRWMPAASILAQQQIHALGSSGLGCL